MIKFVELNDKGETVSERDIDQKDVQKCPHVILMAEHYRTDGSCRCDDPTHTIMIEWGYVWDDGQWINKEEDDADQG
jgi:hypothetical protein